MYFVFTFFWWGGSVNLLNYYLPKSKYFCEGEGKQFSNVDLLEILIFCINEMKIFTYVILSAKDLYTLKRYLACYSWIYFDVFGPPLKYGLSLLACSKRKKERKKMEHGCQFYCCNGTAVLLFLHRFEHFKGNG